MILARIEVRGSNCSVARLGGAGLAAAASSKSSADLEKQDPTSLVRAYPPQRNIREVGGAPTIPH